MKLAVIGTGIAGLGAAYLLSKTHDVEVFEQAATPGGHTNTVRHTDDDGVSLALDTGFIVHNRVNYPNLVRLFDELGVATQESEMSFSVSCSACGLEYSGVRLWRQGANLMNPRFIGLMREITRFMRTAERACAGRDDETLDAFVAREGYSQRFRNHFLVPITAAIWSTAPGETAGFPAAYAVRFLANHGMLRVRKFAWRTVAGGSQTYVAAIAERLGRRLHCATPVLAVRRSTTGPVLTLPGGERAFDGVVIATHANQALAMLTDASDVERRILGAFSTTVNETVLHADPSVLPRRASARAAWNYRVVDCRDPEPTLVMTYDLNRLQRLATDRNYLVTLNRGSEIAEERVIARLSYAHPRYTLGTLRAQRELSVLAGVRSTWFCGAWQGAGFHEDGFVSAVRVARDLGVAW